MIVNVHTIEAGANSTIAVGVGIDPETGDTIRFGGDWRPMQAIANLVEQQGEVSAEVEDWAILSTVPAKRFICTRCKRSVHWVYADLVDSKGSECNAYGTSHTLEA